jgi:hypothetical protein
MKKCKNCNKYKKNVKLRINQWKAYQSDYLKECKENLCDFCASQLNDEV